MVALFSIMLILGVLLFILATLIIVFGITIVSVDGLEELLNIMNDFLGTGFTLGSVFAIGITLILLGLALIVVSIYLIHRKYNPKDKAPKAKKEN